MKQKAILMDTTLRDGEQRPGCAFSHSQKLQVAMMLDGAGIYQIDAGTPAMGREECDIIREIAANRVYSNISVWCRMNERDLRQAIGCSPDNIHISAPISDSHIYSKLGKDKTWLKNELFHSVEFVQDKGMTVTVGFEDASRADINFMSEISSELRERKVLRVQFSDTVGILTPQRTYEYLTALIRGGSPPITFHGHNDLGMAVANSIAALRAGAVGIEATLLGLGERAGNCDLEKLVGAISQTYDTGLTLDNARLLSRKAREILCICDSSQ